MSTPSSVSSLAIPTPTGVASLGYLDRALKALAPLGLATVDVSSTQAIIGLVSELEAIDQTKALLVARTLQQGPVFNEAVRSQVADMTIGSRYEGITQRFDSILTDAKEMLSQIEENRNGVRERLGRLFMKLSRGSIHTRFNKVRELYMAISLDVKGQLDREKAILDAYVSYRGALKEAEIVAVQMLKVQATRLETSKGTLALAADTVGMVPEGDGESLARAQLARDETQRAYEIEDRRYQLMKEITEQLRMQHAVGDTVYANLNQTTTVKRAVHDKGVAFFPTADIILTSLDANLTSTAGLNEARRAIDATTGGINRGLEVLAEVGHGVKTEALKTAYGTSIKADAVRKLVDSIVSFQADSIKAISDLRKASEEEASQIAAVVDEGKDKLARLVSVASAITAPTV